MSDYAPGVANVLDRVLAGCLAITNPPTSEFPMNFDQYQDWVADIRVFNARLARHEFSMDDARRVATALSAVGAGLWGQSVDFTKGKRFGDVDAWRRELDAILNGYHTGPAHLRAIEEQWKALKFNAMSASYDGVTVTTGGFGSPLDAPVGALQNATIDALKVAEAYCWSPTTVEAVATASESMPPECGLSPTALGELGAPGKAGWWWFQTPIPIKTSSGPEPVVALLWRRESVVVAAPRPFSFTPVTPRKDRIWFSTMVMETLPFQGRLQPVCVPTAAWAWPDDVSLQQLPELLSLGYKGYYGGKRPDGHELAGHDVTVEASVWFSRFFLSAATWLRQRVVTPEVGPGARQITRQIAREHKLSVVPKVHVVELRRRAPSPNAGPSDGDKRSYSCRWVVHGHMRNQFYRSTNTHAPKWIEGYVKGPESAPLRETARVYAVRR